jgi:hypothetical protein
MPEYNDLIRNMNASDEQLEKHFSPRMSTYAGIHRDDRDEHQQNDLDPITFKHEIPENATSEGKKQSRKQPSPSDSIDAGTG